MYLEIERAFCIYQIKHERSGIPLIKIFIMQRFDLFQMLFKPRHVEYDFRVLGE